MSTQQRELAPRCARCGSRHLGTLPCWAGQYATKVRRRTLREARAASNDPLQPARCWIGGPKCTGRATTVDHVIPRAYGGDDSPANTRPCCSPCNSWRQARANPFEPEAPTRPAGLGLSPRWRPR